MPTTPSPGAPRRRFSHCPTCESSNIQKVRAASGATIHLCYDCQNWFGQSPGSPATPDNSAHNAAGQAPVPTAPQASAKG